METVCPYRLLCLILASASAMELSNVALQKPTHQYPATRIYGPNVASLAVDGNRGNTLDVCAHTYCTADKTSCNQHWWAVDLQGFYVIHAVVITNRGEDMGFRLQNFDLEVYSENPVAVVSAKPVLCFHQREAVEDGATVRFNCTPPARGRYLRVNKMTSKEPLQLCEVEVLAELDSAVNVRQFARLEARKLQVTSSRKPLQVASSGVPASAPKSPDARPLTWDRKL